MDNILKAIRRAYDKEPFRIKDIINSVNDNQIKCKEWLLPIIPEYDKAAIIGGWYGLLASQMKGYVRSIDLDPGCKEYGKILYPDVQFKTDDGFYECKQMKYDLVICASCEHIDQNELNFLTSSTKSTFLFQSNNYHEIGEHINCKNSLEEFLADYDWSEIYYKGELDMGKYKRWMVCGQTK